MFYLTYATPLDTHQNGILPTVKYLLSTAAAILDIMRVKSGIGLKVSQLHGRATSHKLETCATINIVVEKEIQS